MSCLLWIAGYLVIGIVLTGLLERIHPGIATIDNDPDTAKVTRAMFVVFWPIVIVVLCLFFFVGFLSRMVDVFTEPRPKKPK
jgi:Na+/proline symporter